MVCGSAEETKWLNRWCVRIMNEVLRRVVEGVMREEYGFHDEQSGGMCNKDERSGRESERLCGMCDCRSRKSDMVYGVRSRRGW